MRVRVRVSSFFLPKWSAIRPEGTSKTYVKAKVTECSTPIWKSEEKAGQGAESSGCARPWGGAECAEWAECAEYAECAERAWRACTRWDQHGAIVTNLEEGVAPLHQDEQQVCLSAWSKAVL